MSHSTSGSRAEIRSCRRRQHRNRSFHDQRHDHDFEKNVHTPDPWNYAAAGIAAWLYGAVRNGFSETCPRNRHPHVGRNFPDRGGPCTAARGRDDRTNRRLCAETFRFFPRRTQRMFGNPGADHHVEAGGTSPYNKTEVSPLRRRVPFAAMQKEPKNRRVTWLLRKTCGLPPWSFRSHVPPDPHFTEEHFCGAGSCVRRGNLMNSVGTLSLPLSSIDTKGASKRENAPELPNIHRGGERRAHTVRPYSSPPRQVGSSVMPKR